MLNFLKLLFFNFYIRKKYGRQRNIYIFAGLEPVFRKVRNGWEIKVSECSRCGECCKAIDERHILGTENGCRYLDYSMNQWLCGLNIFRPHGCAIADGSNMNIKSCTVKWKSIKLG